MFHFLVLLSRCIISSCHLRLALDDKRAGEKERSCVIVVVVILALVVNDDEEENNAHRGSLQETIVSRLPQQVENADESEHQQICVEFCLCFPSSSHRVEWSVERHIPIFSLIASDDEHLIDI